MACLVNVDRRDFLGLPYKKADVAPEENGPMCADRIGFLPRALGHKKRKQKHINRELS